jgi:hypothetical protein
MLPRPWPQLRSEPDLAVLLSFPDSCFTGIRPAYFHKWLVGVSGIRNAELNHAVLDVGRSLYPPPWHSRRE